MIDHGVSQKALSSRYDGQRSDTADVSPGLVGSEAEPQTPYQLSWRTILAFLALAMGNVCAALANTVCS